MTTIIRKNTKIAEAKKLMVQIKRKAKKPFNPDRYSGTIEFDKDSLELQKEWRREWNRF